MALAAHVNMREEQCNIIPKQIRLKDVLDCNGFDLGDGAPGGPAGLFLHVSRLNRSKKIAVIFTHSMVGGSKELFHACARACMGKGSEALRRCAPVRVTP
jgi:hypothetical protein